MKAYPTELAKAYLKAIEWASMTAYPKALMMEQRKEYQKEPEKVHQMGE